MIFSISMLSLIFSNIEITIQGDWDNSPGPASAQCLICRRCPQTSQQLLQHDFQKEQVKAAAVVDLHHNLSELIVGFRLISKKKGHQINLE